MVALVPDGTVVLAGLIATAVGCELVASAGGEVLVETGGVQVDPAPREPLEAVGSVAVHAKPPTVPGFSDSAATGSPARCAASAVAPSGVTS